MTQVVEIFSVIFLNMLEDLSNYYPEYPNFKETLVWLKRFNIPTTWTQIIRYYKVYIEPFKQQIADKDESFFIGQEFESKIQHDIKEMGIEQELDNIRELYHKEKTTDEIKERIWDYIIKLTNLAFL